LPDISSGFQRIGRCNFVTVADCNAGYWQIPMLEEDNWLTAFVCDDGLLTLTGHLFDFRGSGNTFVRAMHVILCVPCVNSRGCLLMMLLSILTNGRSI